MLPYSLISFSLLLSLLTAASASTSSFNLTECAIRAGTLALSNSSTSAFLVKPDGSLAFNLSEAWGITHYLSGPLRNWLRNLRLVILHHVDQLLTPPLARADCATTLRDKRCFGKCHVLFLGRGESRVGHV